MRWLLLGSLVSSRIVYAINWFNISPALPFVAAEFGVNLAGLGVLGTAFLVGIGIFQIPAGLVAARIGARTTSMIGLATSSLFGGLSGLAPDYSSLILFRFLTGTGMAFFFSPAMGFFAPLFGDKERGFAIGVFNSSFSVGSAIAFGVWSILVAQVGWRVSLLIGGVLGLVLTLENLMVSRGISSGGHSSKVTTLELGGVLRNKNVWLIAVALTGVGGTQYVVSQFIVIYLKDILSMEVATAGLVATAISVASIIGAPVGGKASDMMRRRVRFLTTVNILVAVGAAILISPHLWSVILAMLVMGFAVSTSYTLSYSTAVGYRDIDRRFVPLAVSMINSTQLLGSSVSPTIFSTVAQGFGYVAAWLFLSAFAAVFSSALLLVKEPHAARAGG